MGRNRGQRVQIAAGNDAVAPVGRIRIRIRVDVAVSVTYNSVRSRRRRTERAAC